MEAPGAILDYDKCLELDPNYNKAYGKKADCHFMMKEYHKALEYYEKGKSVDPNNIDCQQGI
jgi:stress-induced-phosphoprotein 1